MKKWIVWGIFLGLTVCGFANDCTAPPVAIPEATPEAMAFYRSGNVLYIVQLLWSLVVPALIVFTRFGMCLRNFCTRITKIWFWNVTLFALFFLLITTLLSMPLDYYSEYVRLHDYGLSNQTFSRWLNHYLTGTGVTTVLAIILVWIVYGIIRKSPKRWWLYFGLLNFPLAIVLVFIQPIWIAPLFNDFGPMKNKELEHKILSLASQAGIEGSRVYEVDMSADTKQVNAYVTGIGSSKRIVIWDTAIKSLSEDELLFVVGHEMGHYVLHHLWWGILVYTLITLVTLFLVHVTIVPLIRKWGQWMGFTELRDIASLPFLILIYSVYSFLLAPVGNLFSRSIEHNADTFGLELTRLNHAAATGFVKLTSTNLSNPWPGPIFVFFRSSHPPIGERMTYFNTYKPWCHGQPLKYGRFFKPESGMISYYDSEKDFFTNSR